MELDDAVYFGDEMSLLPVSRGLWNYILSVRTGVPEYRSILVFRFIGL
jgi:hypothetical protein